MAVVEVVVTLMIAEAVLIDRLRSITLQKPLTAIVRGFCLWHILFFSSECWCYFSFMENLIPKTFFPLADCPIFSLTRKSRLKAQGLNRRMKDGVARNPFMG